MTSDYTEYDYPNTNNDEGVWYDEVAPAPVEYTHEKPIDKDTLALVQLYLDSLNGKYNVEDLETIVREKIYEDKAGKELHDLMAKKVKRKPTDTLFILYKSNSRF